MYLVLCSASDSSGIWAYEKLAGAGLAPISLVTAECLGPATRWEHRLGAGGVFTKLALEDGRTFASWEIRGVLNRFAFAPESAAGLGVDGDREYARFELGAFHLSWIYALPRVINRPTPQGLCGRWRHAVEWALLAAQAGFRTTAYQSGCQSAGCQSAGCLSSGSDGLLHLIVLRGAVYGPAVPLEQQQACRNLALNSGTELLGVDLFQGDDGGLTFAHATPFPDLTLGGADLVRDLKRALEGDSP